MTRFDGSSELRRYPRDESPSHAGVGRVGFDPAQVIGVPRVQDVPQRDIEILDRVGGESFDVVVEFDASEEDLRQVASGQQERQRIRACVIQRKCPAKPWISRFAR